MWFSLNFAAWQDLELLSNLHVSVVMLTQTQQFQTLLVCVLCGQDR